jgi:hypothetical protein
MWSAISAVVAVALALMAGLISYGST